MAEHHIHVIWKRNEAAFLDKRFPRQHTWIINNTTEIPAAASPLVVPSACTDASAIDPEEAFVASLASCHMLWFLSLAADQGYCIDTYTDQARGTLAKDKDGRLAITRVTLRPYIVFLSAGNVLPPTTSTACTTQPIPSALLPIQ